MPPSSSRSNRSEVRNPILGLPTVRRILSLPAWVREEIATILLDLHRDAKERADKCWKTGKAPMAVYWKACSVYAGHLRRALRRGLPEGESPRYCYTGRCGCGELVAAQVIDEARREEMAKFLASIARAGLTVERLPAEQTSLSYCACTKAKHEKRAQTNPRLWVATVTSRFVVHGTNERDAEWTAGREAEDAVENDHMNDALDIEVEPIFSLDDLPEGWDGSEQAYGMPYAEREQSIRSVLGIRPDVPGMPTPVSDTELEAAGQVTLL